MSCASDKPRFVVDSRYCLEVGRVVCGEVSLHGVVLQHGDGAGFTREPAISLTAREPTEVLVVDLGPPPSPFAAGALRASG